MKALKVFKNASVVSVVNGEITLKLEDGFVLYDNASLVSIHDGTVELAVTKEELEMSDLQTGMVVKYGNGQYRLVVRVSDELIRLVDLRDGGSGAITRRDQSLLRVIVKVWEPRLDGSLDEWMRVDSRRKVIFER